MTHDALRRHRRVLLVAPTGSGKRILLVNWCLLGAERDRRILFVTDRRILVHQMRDECKEHGVPYGIVMGDEPRNEEALVQIASIQTLKRRGFYDMPDANLILIDESHKESKGYATLLEKHPEAKVIGVTATPVGAAGKALVPRYFDEMVEGVRNTELLREGWLLRTECWCPSEPDVKGVQISKGEYNQKQLGEQVEKCTVFADVFKWWAPYSNMQTIVFSPKVAFAYGLAQQFTERGYSAEVIEAGTKKEDRSDCFERFATRDLRVLVSVDVLREGFDAPIAQCGIDLQPNYQFRTYWQKVGRIRRSYEGQEKAIWLDFAGNYWRFLHPDQDPQWDEVTVDRPINDVIRAPKPPGDPKPWSCPKCAYTLAPWERLRDGACPDCGHKGGKPIRRIRMAGGRMRSVSAQQKKKKQASTDQRLWDACRYKAFYCGKTLDFARFLFRSDTGRWPPGGLKSCPETPTHGDWKRKVGDVYPWMMKRRKTN